MNVNLQTLMKLRGAWRGFRANHPNLLPFLNDVSRHGVREGVRFEILAHYPDGTELNCGIRVRQSDVAFFDLILKLFG